MPIRFRCPQCNQLIGIARRKSGSMVVCPTCKTSVMVPLASPPDESPAQAPPPPASLAPPPAREVFERDDFDALLRGATSGVSEPRNGGGSVHAPGSGVRPGPPPLVPVAPVPEPFNVEAWNPRPPRTPTLASEPVGGVILSPTQATILTVVVILLLAIAFGGGLIVGRFYLG